MMVGAMAEVTEGYRSLAVLTTFSLSLFKESKGSIRWISKVTVNVI